MEYVRDILFVIGPFLLMLILIPVTILLMRWLGAWILRINEVIKLQNEILEELKTLNSKE